MSHLGRHLIAVIAVIVALLSFPVAIVVSGRVRAEQRSDQCISDRRHYDTLHSLIEEVGKSDPQGSAIDSVRIPPGTDPQVVEILRQLSTGNNPPPNLDRFYAILDGRPKC